MFFTLASKFYIYHAYSFRERETDGIVQQHIKRTELIITDV